MPEIGLKITSIKKVLSLLYESIQLFEGFKKTSQHTKKEEKIILALRDSIIQRFEYCTDLFWKVLKIHLEEIEKVTLSTYSPVGVIRAAVEARIITEDQGQGCLEMIKSRNLTSHIYHEEVA